MLVGIPVRGTTIVSTLWRKRPSLLKAIGASFLALTLVIFYLQFGADWSVGSLGFLLFTVAWYSGYRVWRCARAASASDDHRDFRDILTTAVSNHLFAPRLPTLPVGSNAFQGVRDRLGNLFHRDPDYKLWTQAMLCLTTGVFVVALGLHFIQYYLLPSLPGVTSLGAAAVVFGVVTLHCFNGYVREICATHGLIPVPVAGDIIARLSAFLWFWAVTASDPGTIGMSGLPVDSTTLTAIGFLTTLTIPGLFVFVFDRGPTVTRADTGENPWSISQVTSRLAFEALLVLSVFSSSRSPYSSSHFEAVKPTARTTTPNGGRNRSLDSAPDTVDVPAATDDTAMRILAGLENTYWTCANDVQEQASDTQIETFVAYRHEHDRLRVSETEVTKQLAEPDADTHDFSQYRRDPGDRHDHVPDAFTDTTIPYLTSSPTWDTCSACRGRGQTECATCNATGEVTCPECNGTAYAPCPDCGGSNRTTAQVTCGLCGGSGEVTMLGQPDGGETQACSDCHGSGTVRDQVDCPNCDANGEVACTYCARSGFVPCTDCDGDGIVVCDTCKGGGELLTFTVLEREFTHEETASYTPRDVPDTYLADADGTHVDERAAECAADDVVKHRVTDIAISVAEVTYEYADAEFLVYEVDDELRADVYPYNTARKLAPAVATAGIGIIFIVFTI